MDKLALFGGEKARTKAFTNRAFFGNEERKGIAAVLKSGILSGFVARAGDNFYGGKYVRELENQVKKYFDIKYAVSVNSATAGLHAAIGACGIGPGDEVIVTPYSMSASATAIIMMNAIPVFADIEDKSFCIDPKKIEKLISRRTKAIIAVHLFGYPAKMRSIMKIAKKYDLKVIEDCAQAPGALYKGKYVGTFGDAGVFSFNQHKTITCGEGGVAITNNGSLALRMQLIRNHGEAVCESMALEDIDNIVGFNYRMTELEACVALAQFKKLDSLNRHRIALARYLTKKLSVFKGLALPQEGKGSRHVYFVYPIRLTEKRIGITRDNLVRALQAEGIPCGAGYVRPIYMEPIYRNKIAYGKRGCPFTCVFYKKRIDYSKGICPVTELMHERDLMLLPVCRYPHTRKDMDDVVRAFKKIYNNLSVIRKELE